MPGHFRQAALPAALPVALVCLAGPAGAATHVATSTTLASVFAGAGAGDTIMLSGRFGTTVLSNRSFATPLRIDARLASFRQHACHPRHAAAWR